MKKTISILMALILSLCIISPMAAYADYDDEITIAVKDYAYFAFEDDYDVTDVSSSDPDIARTYYDGYDGYYVYGVSPGTAIINYEQNEYVYNVKVNIVKPSAMSANKTTLSLNTRDMVSSTAYSKYVDSPCFIYYDSLSGLKISSSNTSVATATIEIFSASSMVEKIQEGDDEYFYDHYNASKGKWIHYIKFNLKKKGTATITVSDDFSHKIQIKLTVKDGKTYDKLKSDSFFYYFYYGDSVLSGETVKNASVKINIGNKTYKTQADSNGKYKIKNIKVHKIGTSFKVTFTSKGISHTQKGKVKTYEPYMENYFYYKNQKKFHGNVKDVHKGDVIKVTIGKKTYTKKIKKNYSKMKYSFKVKPNGNYGTKIKMKIVNKYNQTLTSYSDIIYYSKKLKKGMTMKQAKCVPGWTHPDYSQPYNGGTVWLYDDNSDGEYDSILYFNGRNKLSEWYYE